MTTNPRNSADVHAMRSDWNERARKDAFLYIASWNNNWDSASFFASGEKDYQNLVAPVLQRLSLDPSILLRAQLTFLGNLESAWRRIGQFSCTAYSCEND